MNELIYEIEVENESIIEDLPVNEDNVIELDYSYLDEEENQDSVDGNDDIGFDHEADDDQQDDEIDNDMDHLDL
ncbi:hypothetical protein [Flagellimonas myxillae]|uniref:hypothetical protein n=1 Tax=Flagellimonas myxillae TaxID=2942214 RepID=UPI00201F53A8|nr:hypothetical protein [Muricauda myxillae]MCL6265067.1 hypothetical protein [Muricauda myxillae]